ncbi:MAG TPA: polysaccharide biosynthesis tyrosine autokinase [Solirubrobacterales bacterium]|nr:polysaccharide biosynthesis tyrosine autokinase [Solirubrobacterales bacterium]
MTRRAPEEIEAEKSDLRGVVAVLRRRAGLILLCVVLAAAAAVGFSLAQQKEYSASASLLFRNPGFAESLFGNSVTTPATDPTREAATNEKLVGLEIVAKRTSEHLQGLTAEEISEMVGVSASGEADIVSVTATGPDPAQAKTVANAFAHQFIAFRAQADKAKLTEAKKLAEEEYSRLSPEQQAGPRGEALSSGAEKLGILASLQTGNAELVQPAELPSSPSSPKPLRNGVLAAIIGLLLGCGLAFFFERLDRRLRNPEEARDAFGLPILATVPESKAIMASNRRTAALELPFMENEAFRMLRAQLRYFNTDRVVQTVAISSHAAGVGKSTVAWNLARIAATSSSAIVVEADLRNPTLSAQHALGSAPGLAELLTHQVGLDAAIQSKPLSGGSNGAGIGGTHLDVIVAGSHPPNPAELIESQTMSDILAELKRRYELVVIDTAPIGVVSDAIPLLRMADGLIVVARIGETTRDAAAEMANQLDRLGVPTLGVVANAIKLPRRSRYGYGYGPGPQEAPVERPSDAQQVKAANQAHRSDEPPPRRRATARSGAPGASSGPASGERRD